MSTSDPARSGAPSDDPWEQLAEQLFGTECGKEHVAADHARQPAAVERFEPELPAATADAVAEACAPSCADETGKAIPSAAERTSQVAVEASLAPAEPVKSKPATAEDSYWDALANFSWDKPVREPRSSRGVDRPGRQASSSAVEPKQEIREARMPEPNEPARSSEAELGGSEGLIWDSEEESEAHRSEVEEPQVARDKPREPHSAREVAPPPQRDQIAERAGRFADKPGGDDEGKGRRRRRRHRERREDEVPSGTSSAAPMQPEFPGADWDEPEVNDQRREADSRPQRAGFEAASGSDMPAAEPDDWEPEGFGEPDESDASGAEPDLAVDDDEESGESFVSYANVPTWEEAISYLLHPEQVQAEGTVPPPRGPAPQQPESRHSRHYGKKHRR